MLPPTHNVYDDVIRCEVPPPNLNSTNTFFSVGLGPNRQIYRPPILLATQYVGAKGCSNDVDTKLNLKQMHGKDSSTMNIII